MKQIWTVIFLMCLGWSIAGSIKISRARHQHYIVQYATSSNYDDDEVEYSACGKPSVSISDDGWYQIKLKDPSGADVFIRAQRVAVIADGHDDICN